MEEDAMTLVEKSIEKYIKTHKLTDFDAKQLRSNFGLKMGMFGMVHNGYKDPMKVLMTEKYRGDISKFYKENILTTN